MKMKKILMRIMCIILLIACVAFCGCDNQKKDNENKDKGKVFISIAPYEAKNVEDLLKPWYEVQKGILQWSEEPSTNEEDDANDKISYFYNIPTITIVSSKKQEIVFNRIEVLRDSDPDLDADKTIRFYFDYIEKGEVKDFISVSINGRISRYIELLEEYGDEDHDGMVYVPFPESDYSSWYINNGVSIIYVHYPNKIVSFDSRSIFETFDFDTIGFAEYESQMMK